VSLSSTLGNDTLRICAPITSKAHHEVAMNDLTQWHESMDELESVSTNVHKCRENEVIWGEHYGLCLHDE